MVPDLGFVEISLELIRHEDIDQIARLGRLGGCHRFKPVADRLLVIRRTLQLRDDHVAAAVAQVLGLCVSLATVPDDGDRFFFQMRKVSVVVVINLGWHRVFLLV